MPRILMCPPDHYGIDYEINPWMRRSVKSILATAREQWWDLYQTLTETVGANVSLIRPAAGLPDMVFTANAGVVRGDVFIPSRFRHKERRGEEKHFERYFKNRGYTLKSLPRRVDFEGAGDALFLDGTLYAGYRFRTDIRAHEQVGKLLDCPVLSLELTDPHHYHLDTCFCPLDSEPGKEAFIYYPGAFDDYGRKLLEEAAPHAIAVTKAEARRFACNAVSVGQHVILPKGCPKLKSKLRALGYTPHDVAMTEYLKSGGACKCLTLRLE